MAVPICALLDAGWRVVVVHGNGPQVGNLAIQQEMASGEVPEMPLFSLGAMTEGQLGSLIAIALYGVCGRRHRIAALLSHVIVDLDDPAFDLPTKPIGPFFSEEAATMLAETRGWDITEDSGRGFRRVVASPEPKGFVEIEAIGCLLEAGHVVVTGGGGGIPVGRRGDVWDGVDAVIDKDYAAAELGPPAAGRGARPHHRGGRRPARLRQADPATADVDGLRRGRTAPHGGAVPGREHGAQGAVPPSVSSSAAMVGSR